MTPSRNYEWVFEADIEACFDAIDHLLAAALFGDVPAGLGGDVTAALDGDAAA